MGSKSRIGGEHTSSYRSINQNGHNGEVTGAAKAAEKQILSSQGLVTANYICQIKASNLNRISLLKLQIFSI